MNFDWKEQTVIITGAYGGLGKELCTGLDCLGAKLVIIGRDKDKLQQLKSNLSSTTHILAGDITDEGFINSLSKLENSASDGHILINNAAVSDTRFLSELSATSIQQMVSVNLLAPMLLSKALMPWLAAAKSAKIVNIGSTFGAIGYPGFSAYCATKFGLRGFSQALSRELSDSTIQVQYLAPRAIATAINSDKLNQLNKELKNNVDTPEKIASKIIKAISKNKSEKFFGFPEKLFAKINGLFPSVVSASIKKQLATIKQKLK